jgi:hypothetical protein
MALAARIKAHQGESTRIADGKHWNKLYHAGV